jgi:tetratricopeptide (TPR) repeat protein
VLSVQADPFPGRAGICLNQHYDVLKELAESYAALGRLDEAEQCYRQAATLAPGRAEPYVGIGIVAIQRGRLDQAEAAFEIATERVADCAEAYGGLAMVRQQQGDYPGALDMYLRCLELDTDNLVALLGLFQTSCQMGTFAQVIHYLELYLDRHPGDVAVLFCLATLYAREDRLGRAEDCLLSVLALEPGKAEAARLLEQVRDELAAVARRDVISA